MEGAKFDTESEYLTDSDPKVLFSKMPKIWLKPIPKS